MRQAGESRPAAGGRRIIERPRLIKLLDDATAKTILLVAPAGYGKTTLARQWIDNEPGSLLTVSSAASDLAVVARGVARAMSNFVPNLPRVVDEAIRATSSSQTQLKSLIRAILGEVDGPRKEWLAIDDYHRLEPGSPSDTLFETIESSGIFNMLVASRTRPVWATSRRFLYGEILELTQHELALDEDELRELLPERGDARELGRMTQGWPALAALAAVSTNPATVPTRGSSQTMYRFFADEVFDQASPVSREALLRITLLPPLSRNRLAERLGESAVTEAIASGLAYEAGETVEIHPLMRAFLHEKVESRRDLDAAIDAGIDFALDRCCWDDAFDLIQRFRCTQKVAALLERAYLPLLDAGRIATLESIGTFGATLSCLSQAMLDLIGAEIALRDGILERAADLGRLAGSHLPTDHPLRPRAYIIAGSAEHLNWHLNEALELFSRARNMAKRPRDASDASWGQCLSAIFLEDEHLRPVADEYASQVDSSAEDRLRVLMTRQNLARLWDGLYDLRLDQTIAESLLPAIPDPLVRTGWGNSHGYMLVLQGRYSDAKSVLNRVLVDLDRYALAFGLPHVEWSLAAAELGLRQFARADFLLRRVERQVGENRSPYLHLNTRALRARLLLTQRRPDEAIAITSDLFDDFPRNAMYGEYRATHALALAASGSRAAAIEAATDAVSFTRSVEVRVLAATAVAVAAQGTAEASSRSRELLELACNVDVWDAVVVAVRAVPPLLTELGKAPAHRAQLAHVLARSNDHALARTAGLADQGRFRPDGLLTRRETEVIDLLAQGLKTRDVAGALYIAETTVKVHVRNIREKLNARTRAEAVARYTEASARAGASDTSDRPL